MTTMMPAPLAFEQMGREGLITQAAQFGYDQVALGVSGDQPILPFRWTLIDQDHGFAPIRIGDHASTQWSMPCASQWRGFINRALPSSAPHPSGLRLA